MRREKVFNRSLLLLAIMSIMLFAMTITASAAQGKAVTGLKQTDDSKTSVKVEWNSNYGESYAVFISSDRTTGYQAVSSYTTSSNSKYISSLQAGRTYYVIVQTYVDKQLVGQSDPFQVVTSPESVDYKSIKQTSGTKNKIGLQWNSVSGASGYVLAKISGSKVEKQYNLTTNKATIPAQAGKHYGDYYVYTYRRSESNYIALSYSSWPGTLYAAPVNPQYVADAKAGTLEWVPAKKGNIITIGWKPNTNYDYPTGYQIQIYSLDGKKRLYTTKTTTRTKITINNAKLRKAINNRGFKVRIRSYKEANGGVKCWSDWSAFKAVVPQVCTKRSNFKVVSSSAVKVTWKKIANAKYYVVYYSKNPYSSNAKWVKKKVSAKTTSFVVRGLKKYQTFCIYAVPVVKVGGKTYRGQVCEYPGGYIH